MSQVGDRLRQARESRGLSIAQVATETRIRQQYLEALEDGRYDGLPNDVVSKGFLRNYAQVLSLPVDELIDMYRAERGLSQPIRVQPAGSMPPTQSYVLPNFFGVFFVTVMLVALTYVALSALGQIRDQAFAERLVLPSATAMAATPTPFNTQVPATRAPQVAAAPDETAPDEAAPDETAPDEAAPEATPAEDSPEATPEQVTPETDNAGPLLRATPFALPTSPAAGFESSPTPEPTPTLEAPIVVEVSTVSGEGEGSWLRVRTDGTIAYEQIMRPGERQVFLAQRQVQIRAGNPTFVQVRVNGLQPEILGQIPGEPVDWAWPPQ